jgi:hypothetical protein
VASFNKNINLEKHKDIKHLKSKPLNKEQCPECEANFEEKCQLEHHMEIVHPIPYKCHICDSCFENKVLLKHHLKNVHPNLKIHKCKHCNKTFYEKSKLKKHIDKKHKSN